MEMFTYRLTTLYLLGIFVCTLFPEGARAGCVLVLMATVSFVVSVSYGVLCSRPQGARCSEQ
jgi:hypothetical protein